jgi:serine/threonine-protein phosphatase 2A activator
MFKAIRQQSDVERWLSSTTAASFLSFVKNVADASRGGEIEFSSKNERQNKSSSLCSVVDIIQNATKLVQDHPPVQQRQRYGNSAFRGWLAAIEANASTCMMTLLSAHSTAFNALSKEQQDVMVEEVAMYWKICFGNGTRIDYGTGHEAAFLMWVYCLGKLGVLETDANVDSNHLRDLALCVYPAYLHLARVLQRTYMLEPAGSHGVWSLDDYCFLPFLFGASQLSSHKNIRPRSILYADTVDGFADKYLYLGAIQFINNVKTGPFNEHSHILNEIAKGVSSWEDISAGLMQMFRVEVLGKFPVAQHFYFGTLLMPTWLTEAETDTMQTKEMSSGDTKVPPKAPATSTAHTILSCHPGTGVAMPRLGQIPTLLRRPTPIPGAVSRGEGGTDVLSRYFVKRGRGSNSSSGSSGSGSGSGTSNTSSFSSAAPRVATPRASSSKHVLHADDHGIDIAGWSITTNKGKMTDSIELSQMPAASDITFPTPEIVFGHNSLTFEHKATGIIIDFNALDSLRSCLIKTDTTTGEPNRNLIQFALAEQWAIRSKALNINMSKQAGCENFDWTYTPVYYGTWTHQGQSTSFHEMTRVINEGELGIDYERLKDRNAPILWYNVCEFYETELDDCGSGTLEAKLRVMPTCFFMLLRWWLRVDNTMVRLFDTRIYHNFAENRIVFETVQKEMSYEEIKKAGRSTSNTAYTDPNTFAEWLKEVKGEVRVLEL